MKTMKWPVRLAVLAAVILLAGFGLRAHAADDPNIDYDRDTVHDGTVGKYYEASIYYYIYGTELDVTQTRIYCVDPASTSSGLPTGTSVYFDQENCRVIIKGTPSQAGTFEFFIQFVDSDWNEYDSPNFKVRIDPSGKTRSLTATNCTAKHADGTAGTSFYAGELVTLSVSGLAKNKYVAEWENNKDLRIPTGDCGQLLSALPLNSFYMPAENGMTVTPRIEDKNQGYHYQEALPTSGADNTCGERTIESLLFMCKQGYAGYKKDRTEVSESRMNRSTVTIYLIDLDKDGHDDMELRKIVSERSNQSVFGAFTALDDRNLYGEYMLDIPPSKINNGSTRGLYSKLRIFLGSDLSVTGQPEAASVSEGGKASFTVSSNGAGPSYQWQWRAGLTGTWANCTSATTGYHSATLKVTGTEARNGYHYRCRITDSSGRKTYSEAATLYVLKQQPKAVSTVLDSKKTASFTVSAYGSGLTYQWQWRAGSSGDWADCTSATTGYRSATLKVSAGSSHRNGYQYRCRILDGNGKVTYSAAAPLYLLKKQPVNAHVKGGSTASFTAVGVGSGLTYRWQWRSGSSGTWANCTSATTGYNTSVLKVAGTAGRNGYQYRCRIVDSAGVISYSKAVTLNVLAVTKQPVSTQASAGSTAKFTVTAVGKGTLSYQWQWRSGSSGTWTDCTAKTEGYNKPTLKVDATKARNGYQYRCVVSDSGLSVNSSPATLTVK